VRLIIILIYVFFSCFSSITQAFQFTSGGNTYEFSTVNGFSANQSLLSSQPWWQNQSLATTFAGAVNNTAPNNTLFAFNYTVASGWSGGAYVDEVSNSYCCGPNGGAININSANSSTFAVVLLIPPPPPPGPSAMDTQASIQVAAQKLRGAFNAASVSSNFANMNTYDCNLFDKNRVCLSAGGRYTDVDKPDSNSTSAVFVLGYQVNPTIRIGGFLDQNTNNNMPSGIKVSNKNPLAGAFVVWNQSPDALGYQVKLANAYQDKDVNTTREVIGSSEAGRGDTNLIIKSYVGELSYAFHYQDKTLLRPYLALRYTSVKQDAYTETNAVMPLSYSSLEDRSTTALLGLKLSYAVTANTKLTASLGVEQDLKHNVDNYSAQSTGISGLTTENFNDDIDRTRPVASAGAYYSISKAQRIMGDIFYQQLPFQSTGSTTAYINYMIGL